MKRFRWIFALAAVVLVVAISFVIIRNNRRSAVEKYKAELRAKGEKISFAELGFPRTPEKPEAVQRLTNALNRIVANGFVNAGGVLTMSINYVAPGKASIGWRDGDNVRISVKSTNLLNWAKLQAQCTGASNELARNPRMPRNTVRLSLLQPRRPGGLLELYNCRITFGSTMALHGRLLRVASR